MSVSMKIRILSATSVAGVVIAGPVGLAQASPPSVDNVVNVITQNIAAGKWGLAESNIVSLDKTIRTELKTRKNPVAVASNPVQARLDAVNQRLALLKADYQWLYDARTRIDKASVKQAKLLIAQLRLEIVSKLNLINARGALDALDALDTDGAEEIAGTAQRLQTQDRSVKYLSRLINSLRPAIHESQNDRTHLIPLNRQFGKVLTTYGITAGGAAVQPSSGATTAAQHPKVAGVWTQPQYCDASGGRITITQAANGDVTGINMSWPGCPATIVGKNFVWESPNTLVYDVTNTGPGWAPTGGHRVTFSADGRSNSVDWWDSLGRSGTTSWTRVS